MIRHWKTFPTIIAFGCCWLVLQSTVAVGEDGIMMMAMTMQEFCGDSNLKQIETYMNSLRFTELNYQNMSEVNILSNNATGYQCHCNFLGTVVECRLWTSQNCDHRYDAWCQEIVVTDILHFQNTTSPDDASSSLVVSHPGWIETCSYPLSNNYDDRIKYDPVQYPLLDYNHSSPFLCERLVLSSSSSSDGSSGTVRLESCAVTWTYEDYCKICPEGTGTYMTDVGENFFSKNRCQNENTTDGLLSTASLLYQYHLNVQPIQVILKDSELDNTTAIACEDLTADEYCEDLSSVEASFTESLSNLFSFSDLNEVKDGYKCTCDRSTGKGDKVIVGVVCHAQYVLEDWETGEKMEYTDTQQMVLQQRENDNYYGIRRVGSCDTLIGECFQQEMDYFGMDIVTCIERNQTAAFCELCPSNWFHADTIVASFSNNGSPPCDEPAFLVNRHSFFLRYRGLQLRAKSSDCDSAGADPTPSSLDVIVEDSSTSALPVATLTYQLRYLLLIGLL